MAIVFKDVSYTYNEKLSTKKNALNNINLIIEDNLITSITGKSGSGKTTMAELIDILMLPTKGKIMIDNYTISHNCKYKEASEIRKQIGLVFQNPEDQFFNSSVYAEVSFALDSFPFTKEKKIEKVSKALALVGLDDSYMGLNPYHLSCGEKRKIAIASTLVYNPKIVIFDEPTIGLDNKSKSSLIQLIIKLKRDYGKTIIIISHDMDMLLKISDYIYIIDKGNLVLEGTKYDLYKKKELANYNIKLPNLIQFSNLVLAKKGIRLGYRDDINDLIKDIYRHVK